jgi:four helix bundle protein
MKIFRDLQIWQRGLDLSILIYGHTVNFPKEEQFGLTSQLRRASTSVPLNIAEGWGRGSNKSFANFLKIARGSLFEVETILEICFRLDYINNETINTLRNEIEQIGKMINSFIKKLDNNNEVINSVESGNSLKTNN